MSGSDSEDKIPLHITLKRYRILYISTTVFFMWLGFDGWHWFKENHSTMSESAAAGFIAIYLAIIGAIKYVMENSRQDTHHD